MQLPSGIPTIENLNALKNNGLYESHVGFNRNFLSQHHVAMEKYGKHWGLDPFKLWSRRWEYPYVAQKLIDFGKTRSEPMKVLDAGSGVTYFPYYVLDQLPQTQFIACDYDPSYAKMFTEINAARNTNQVQFLEAALQNLPLDAASLDAICCISVLEHTDNYGEIVSEFARVIKPGGLFVLTFDLSLDGKFTLPRPLAEELLRMISNHFRFADGFDPEAVLARMHNPEILTTDHVRKTEPGLLPWTMPVRVYKAAADLVQGRGWTKGFRSRTVVCLSAVRSEASRT